MGRYREDSAALLDLVEDDRVHRDVYTDPEVFTLEMERLWSRSWVYLGHASQLPQAGDFLTLDVAGKPLLVVRQADGAIRAFMNRCAHKGTKVVSAPSGNAGKTFRCPYHAWTYRLDGSLAMIPLKDGYAGTRMNESGLAEVKNIATYRGFVFARLSDKGLGFEEFFGDSLSSIDFLADRSPEGELEITGGCLRYLHNCNWKMFIENLNDTMHPMIVHASSAGTAKRLWEKEPADKPKPMAVEQFVPFVSGYQFFDEMGVKVYPHGHGFSGVHFSIHSAYSPIKEYEDAMQRAYGEERAKHILGTVRHNTVYYPSLTIKGAIQSIRVVRPLAADCTLIESWTFRLKGAPDSLLARTVMYNRLINSPMSVVGHDDLHAYRAIQEGLAAQGNEWVNLQRNYDASEKEKDEVVANGTSDLSMRNQFRAWRELIGCRMTDQDLVKFVVREARLLDEKRFDEWYQLFADDGYYWVPAVHGQKDPHLENSLAYEDKFLLKLRIERLKSPQAFSQQPPSRCLHVLQNPEVESLKELRTRTNFIYTETRGDDSQRYAATAWHTFVIHNKTLKIKLKRVDILNCDAMLPSIQLFL